MALRFPLARPRTALLAGLIAAASVVGAARVQAQQPRPFGTLTVPADSLAPRPFAKFSADAESMRDSIVALARAQLGKRYVLGGTNPRRGFDCSGLVKYVLGMLDISLPRTARQQAKMGEAVAKSTDELKPGDLLTFGKSKRGVSHIAIYIGDGKYIHASSGAGRVIESDLARTDSPLIRAWRGVRRVLVGDDADSVSAAHKGAGSGD